MVAIICPGVAMIPVVRLSIECAVGRGASERRLTNLLMLPILHIYLKYYGTEDDVSIVGTSYGAMIGAGHVVEVPLAQAIWFKEAQRDGHARRTGRGCTALACSWLPPRFGNDPAARTVTTPSGTPSAPPKASAPSPCTSTRSDHRHTGCRKCCRVHIADLATLWWERDLMRRCPLSIGLGSSRGFSHRHAFTVQRS